MAVIPPRENLDYKIASPVTYAVCPFCGQVHKTTVELYYLDKKDYWKQGNYPVICCALCKIKEKEV